LFSNKDLPQTSKRGFNGIKKAPEYSGAFLII
jgi:hypothetical protein